MTVTDMVLANPTVMVPKSISFGLMLSIPSLPAPMISISYLILDGASLRVCLLALLLSKPEPGL